MKRALVLSLICVLGLAFSGLAATLSGSWDTDVTIDPQQTRFDLAIGLVSVLTVTYTVGDWAFTSVTDLDETGWTDQDFSVAGVLGAFSLTSALDFDVENVAFGSWNTTAAVSIAGVSFSADFTLANGEVELILSGSGVAGDVTVAVDVYFGDVSYVKADPLADPPVIGVDANGCDLDWAGIDITIGFPFCCAEIELAIEFDCDGFVEACFSVVDIVVPNVPYMTLDADLCFTMQTKTLVLTPVFDFGAVVCFDLYFDVDYTGNITIQDISIYGIGLSCEINGVTFTGLSQWGDGKKTGLLAKTGYWEVYNIATTDDGCCGDFGFDLSVFFKEGGLALFDVGLIDANMSLQVAAQFEFNMGLKINVDTGGFTEWTIGFLVTW